MSEVSSPLRPDADDPDAKGLRVHLHVGGKERSLVVSQEHVDKVRDVAHTVLREPFRARAWLELFYFCVSSVVAGIVFVVTCVTIGVGVALVVTFVGLFVIATAVRAARGMGGWYRGLARSLLGEHIEEPDAFSPRPGAFGWLQSALRDRAGWRVIGCTFVKIAISVIGVVTALSVWMAAFSCLFFPFTGNGDVSPGLFALARGVFRPGFFTAFGSSGFFHGLFVVLTGVVLLFVAPWMMRLVVYLDRLVMRAMLGPDAVTVRTRSLEEARTQTVDASAATLRRIERDLHDGTQAQLVALAMRLGQAKEALAAGSSPDLDEVRRLVDAAHKGAKEAITELRDLARGIHPPVLDTGLEGALATLAARSPVPTDLTVSVADRPTPAIEAIAYFCVAELLANVVQHAGASRASIRCTQHGVWLRVVVRDDGRGGARPSLVGSSSSGLTGLAERVRAVDGHLEIASPIGGPTVVTIDLPLHA